MTIPPPTAILLFEPAPLKCERCYKEATEVVMTTFSQGKMICRTCEAYLLNITVDRNEIINMFKALGWLVEYPAFDNLNGRLFLWTVAAMS